MEEAPCPSARVMRLPPISKVTRAAFLASEVSQIQVELETHWTRQNLSLETRSEQKRKEQRLTSASKWAVLPLCLGLNKGGLGEYDFLLCTNNSLMWARNGRDWTRRERWRFCFLRSTSRT